MNSWGGTLRRALGLAGLVLLAACQVLQPRTETESPADLVLTSVGPIYSITSALLADTSIQVTNLPDRARSLAAQPTWFAKQAEPYYAEFRQAKAVVSMGHIWQQDPLYISVREQNIGVVNIDATLPFSAQLSGITIANSPATGEVSPYFWLSPANIIRSAKIISNDLVRLFPAEAETIRANEQKISTEILAVKRDYEAAFASRDPYLYALADEFSYLTNEFGLFVDDYFIKQDINWTDEDLANLTQTLKSRGIPVVIHKWEPSDEIQDAISAAGSKLVVLDSFESSTADILDLASDNLEKLETALPLF